MLFQAVRNLLAQLPEISIDPTLLEIPQDRTMGDVALPCFVFAKELRKAPPMIAQELAERLDVLLRDPSTTAKAGHAGSGGHSQNTIGSEGQSIAKVVATGPYVNFFINPAWLASQVITTVVAEGDQYGAGKSIGETLIIESPGPNTNKPLHLGHVRNMLLGNSLAAIGAFAGYDVKKVDIINDRGVHICKSMLAYQRFGNDEAPTKKSDHYVGDRYVRYDMAVKEDPSWEEDIQVMLQQREAHDPEVLALRKKMRDWALEGMSETYARYGCHIDKAYYESDHYLKGKDIVQAGVDQGLFSTNEKGHIIYHDETLGDKVLLRSDGTSIYITQDIALGKLRYDDRHMDRMVYVVGSEQENHFLFLFRIFKALGYTFADACHHMSYGMISLPDGKMKSREGNVVDADTLADEMHTTCVTLLQERYEDMPPEEIDTKAEQIAMAAIKFFIILYDPKKDFVFDREASLRFDGESGPYIQYTYARCCSILERHLTSEERFLPDYTLLVEEEERILLVLLQEFPDLVERAAQLYQPYLVARYVLELARMFNSYYQKVKIVQEDKILEATRVSLVASIQQVLKNALALLGIEAPEKM